MEMTAIRGAVFGIAAGAALVTTAPAQAAGHGEEIEALSAALNLEEMVGIMHAEGIAYGTQIGSDMFPDRAGARWVGMVADIYDPERIYEGVIAGMAEALDATEAQAISAFFTTEPGASVAALELSARRAMLDDEVDAMAREIAALAAADETERFVQIEAFIAANDLIETNVVGALNSNYAFYVGLLNGGAFPQGMSEEQILQDVWAQEPDIRDSTEEWLYSFLMLAYQPLSDGELDTYIAFSETEAGVALNRALFSAFDPVFEEISLRLGFAAAQMLQSADL